MSGIDRLSGGAAIVLCGFFAACGTSSKPVSDTGANAVDSIAGKPDGAPASPDSEKSDAILGYADVTYPDTMIARMEVLPSGGDAGVTTTQGDAATSDGGTVSCPQGVPANTAPAITETVVPDPLPAAKGGTVEVGTYYETAWVRYNNTAMPPDAGKSYQHRQTATITMASSILFIAISTIALDTGAPQEYFIQLQFLSQTEIEFGFMCPFEGGKIYEYDATPGSLTIYSTDVYGPYSWTLTKQ